jgi:hypothetical protein
LTTQTNIPYDDLVADGTLLRYPFTYPIVENVDLIVLVGGVLQIEFSTYTLENITENGGDVLFVTAPAKDVRVLILRRTTMTQNVDYETGLPFMAETHEWNLDKITYILQELIHGAFGGVDSNGDPVFITFDLDAVQNTYSVTITNTGGTDAEIPAWVDATLAGVMHGEVMPAANLPADGAATTEPDGHFWIGI